jgi:hypothetical protein
METFLNQKTVRDALGVGDIEFVSCSSVVYDAMTRDWMRNLAVGVPALLEDGIKVLIYAGEEDLICNWLGKSTWYNKLINPVFLSVTAVSCLLFARKFKVGKWLGMVWPERLRSSSNSSIRC